jgi:hypothetical protein
MMKNDATVSLNDAGHEGVDCQAGVVSKPQFVRPSSSGPVLQDLPR